MASEDVDPQTLSPSESSDSDEVRNDDGDIVVDPPDGWSEADKFGMTAREEREGESLDDRLAEEEPDVPTAEGPAWSAQSACIAVRSMEPPRMATRYSTSTGDDLVVSRSVARNCIAR